MSGCKGKKCNKTSFSLGCFGNCQVIISSLVAEKTGTYKINYLYEEQMNVVPFEGIEGQRLILPNIFNDEGISNFTITDPDDLKVEFIENNITYDKYSIKIIITNNMSDTLYQGDDNAFTNVLKAALESLIDNPHVHYSIEPKLTGDFFDGKPIYVEGEIFVEGNWTDVDIGGGVREYTYETALSEVGKNVIAFETYVKRFDGTINKEKLVGDNAETRVNNNLTFIYLGEEVTANTNRRGHAFQWYVLAD